MIAPDTSQWTELEDRSSNTRYYVIEPGLLVALPDAGAKDNGETAKENCDIQNRYFRECGGGVVLVFVDNLVSQDARARRVYQKEPDPDVFLGTALIGGSLLSRAMISFFTGLTRPDFPLKAVASLEDGLRWARSLLTKHRAKEAS